MSLLSCFVGECCCWLALVFVVGTSFSDCFVACDRFTPVLFLLCLTTVCYRLCVLSFVALVFGWLGGSVSFVVLMIYVFVYVICALFYVFRLFVYGGFYCCL